MTPSQEVSAQLLRSADEFARLADELENSLPSAPQPVEQQQQQAQQQQVQPDAEKKD